MSSLGRCVQCGRGVGTADVLGELQKLLRKLRQATMGTTRPSMHRSHPIHLRFRGPAPSGVVTGKWRVRNERGIPAHPGGCAFTLHVWSRLCWDVLSHPLPRGGRLGPGPPFLCLEVPQISNQPPCGPNTLIAADSVFSPAAPGNTLQPKHRKEQPLELLKGRGRGP